MTKEEAIAFLQEIKFNIDYLRAHYTQNLRVAEESAQQEKLRSMMLEQAQAKVMNWNLHRASICQAFDLGFTLPKNPITPHSDWTDFDER